MIRPPSELFRQSTVSEHSTLWCTIAKLPASDMTGPNWSESKDENDTKTFFCGRLITFIERLLQQYAKRAAENAGLYLR